MQQLPARYDHVGSFLRPLYLLEARAHIAAEARRRKLRLVIESAQEVWADR